MQKVSAADIDALLPQTQCGLCTFAGCKPYAEALANGEAEINLCPPGGVETLQQLGALLAKDPAPFMHDMQTKAKPASVAYIREAECIGCTKCIQACPVDAIIGSAKHMHTVLINECTGCDLCVPACPVDCIEMLPAEHPSNEKRDYFRARHAAHVLRLKHKNIEKQASPLPTTDKQSYLAAALARAKAKSKL